MIFLVPSPSGSSNTVPGLETELNIESCLFLLYYIRFGQGTGSPGVKSQTHLLSMVSFSQKISLFDGVSALNNCFAFGISLISSSGKD